MRAIAALLALLALVLASPAGALDIRSSAVAGRGSPAGNPLCADPKNIEFNRADRTLTLCDPSNNPSVTTLLKALPSGRRAVEQGQADDLTVGGTVLPSALAGKAPLASPIFSGTASFPTLAITGPGSTGDLSLTTALAEGADTARTAAARAADAINAKDYTTFAGAVGKAQATGRPLRLPAGAYSYTSGGYLTVTADLIFEPGAQLACNGNANLGLAGSVTAPATQIFAAGCTPSLYGNSKVSWGFPEWWGAKGDSNGTSGNGTDNKVALQNAINSGAPGLQFAGNAFYRYTETLKPGRINFAMKGVDRTVTRLVFEDPTGTKDSIFIDGSASQMGGITIEGIDLIRLGAAKGYVAAATVVAGGTGHAVNDILTIPGGTCTTQP